ncbi:hypothetical protein HO133_008955 [Letharia lupina]|uniref:Uncharacterized protein n=1 Tax=Letharia lupina TaxID=560253 RepID=A0A8H6CMF1_9LECA|nr:uncharacterized protein HO133_008955 [Letharia lupina]KAF6226090.1 hypothetical protein HO133_008955 [Letharia lupina]
MPGALKSDLNRHMPKLVQLLLLWTLQEDPTFGAYTEAFAGLSPKVDQGRNGAFGFGDGSGGGGWNETCGEILGVE